MLLKNDFFFVKDLTEYRSHIQYVSFVTFKAKIGPLFVPELVFSFRIDWNQNSLGDSNVDYGVNNRPIFALKVPKKRIE